MDANIDYFFIKSITTSSAKNAVVVLPASASVRKFKKAVVQMGTRFMG